MEMEASQNFSERKPLVNSLEETGPGESRNAPDGPHQSGTQGNLADGEEKLSLKEGYIHACKGNTGTGLLSLPYAFSRAGFTVGFIGQIFVSLVAGHCMHLLLMCSIKLEDLYGLSGLDYGRLGEASVANLKNQYKSYSRVLKLFINVNLLITQIGFCCVYMLFVAQNLEQVVSACGGDLPFRWIILILLPFFILGSFIRDLKRLAPFSSIATVLQVISIILIVQYTVRDLHWDEVRQGPSTYEDLATFFGLAVFTVEGIGVVLPLHVNLARPRKFPGVLWAAIISVLVLNVTTGSLGYLRFPNRPMGSITLSLPFTSTAENIPNIYVKLFYAVAICISYLIQLYVAMDVLEANLSFVNRSAWITFAIRAVLGCMTAGVAVSVPNLGVLISLVGAMSSSFVAMIIPALIHITTFWYYGLGRLSLIKDVAIITFGLTGMVLGTYTSVVQL